jgi:CheY-like chemotaxis protein
VSLPDAGQGASARVLVIEDEPMLLRSVVTGLSRLPGVEVVGASSVSAALSEIQARAPAVVISDIDLPDRTGIELLGELGARGLKPHVIFVSAYVKAYRAQIPPHAGVEIMEKPVSLETLRSLVSQRVATPPAISSPFGVADYLQLASLGHHSVVLEIDGPVRGQINEVDGEAWSANDELGDGLSAFRRLALSRDVLVRCQTLSADPGARSLSGSCESLLLECARLQDESSHGAGGEPQGFTELALEEDTVPDSAPTAPEPQPAVSARAPPPVVLQFEELFEQGVEASLAKRYGDALMLFQQARLQRPDDLKVKVNIARLEKLIQGVSES